MREFVLEDKPDAYLVMDQGSEVLDSYRLKEILVSIDGSLINKYVLSYSLNEIQSRSLLSLITQYGSDGITALPPVRFNYRSLDKSFDSETSWATPGERWLRTTDEDNDNIVDVFDVNGDGLPDLVSYEPYHWDI